MRGSQGYGYRVRAAGGEKVLILSREEGESVVIGDDITIVILGIKGREVRVGITAPRNINIYREEILSRLAPPGQDNDQATRLDELRTCAPALATPWASVQTAAAGKRRLRKS